MKCNLTDLRDRMNKATGEEKQRLQAEWIRVIKNWKRLKRKMKGIMRSLSDE